MYSDSLLHVHIEILFFFKNSSISTQTMRNAAYSMHYPANFVCLLDSLDTANSKCEKYELDLTHRSLLGTGSRDNT